MVFSEPAPVLQSAANTNQWCYTCSEQGNRSFIQPGTPHFSCLVVDPVPLSWELILGVEVVIAHSRIDFSI